MIAKWFPISLFAGACALVIALAPTPAAAQSPEVVTLFEQGLAAYRDGRYEDAAELFTRAHAIEAVPDLTYNRARALENLGRHEEAAAAYRLYLDEMPGSPDRRSIEDRIRALDARAADVRRIEEDRARLAEERARLEQERQLPSVRTEPEERGIDPAPWIVLGGGAAVLIAGGVLGGIAQSTFDRANGRDIASTESDRLAGEADDLALAANVLLGIGGAIAAAGAVWAIVDLTQASEQPSAQVMLLPGGVALRGRF